MLAFEAPHNNPGCSSEWSVDPIASVFTRLLTSKKILILIFAEVLGLYGTSSRCANMNCLQTFVLSGLIVALIMNTAAAGASVGLPLPKVSAPF